MNLENLFILSQNPFTTSTRDKKIQKLTLEHGADLLPGGHPTLTGVLAYCQSQEEQRHTTEEEHVAIQDEEGAYKPQCYI